MKKNKEWIIVDAQTEKALYGVAGITLTFSSKDIAEEVADQFFATRERYIVVNVNGLNQTKNKNT